MIKLKPEKYNLIWQSDFDLEDFKDFLDEEEKILGRKFTEDEKYQKCSDMNYIYHDDECRNLDFPCNILVVGSLGLWNGRRSAYMLKSNLNCCLSTFFNGELFVRLKEGNLLSTEWHHDGNNYYTFYIIKDGMEDSQGFKKLLDKIYNQVSVEEKEILKYCSKAGKKVAEIYGFDVQEK